MNILTRFQGFQGKLLYVMVFFYVSLLGIVKQKKLALVTWKPQIHVRISLYQMFRIKTGHSETKLWVTSETFFIADRQSSEMPEESYPFQELSLTLRFLNLNLLGFLISSMLFFKMKPLPLAVNFKTILKLKISTLYQKKVILCNPAEYLYVYQFLDKILLLQSMGSRIKGNLLLFITIGNLY